MTSEVIQLPATDFKVHFSGEGRDRDETFCLMLCQAMIEKIVTTTQETRQVMTMMQESLREIGYDLTPAEAYLVFDTTTVLFEDFKKKLPSSRLSAITTGSMPSASNWKVFFALKSHLGKTWAIEKLMDGLSPDTDPSEMYRIVLLATDDAQEAEKVESAAILRNWKQQCQPSQP